MKFNFKTDFPYLRAGRKEAFDNLMMDFYGWTVNIAKQTVRDPEVAKDVALTFWEKLPETIQRFNSSPGQPSFQSWAGKIIRDLAVDAIRDKQPAVYYNSEPDYNPATSEDPTLQLEALQDLDAVAERLSPTDRDVFWRMIEGASAEEISEEMGILLRTVHKYISRIRGAIRAQLEAR